MTSKRALTGIRASGTLHVGNYLGAIKPALERQATYQCFYFIADLHALTTNRDPEKLRTASLDVTAAWLALGFDSKNHLIYRQSDIPMVTEFAWYLSCCTGMGLLEKGHAYKDAIAGGKEVNHGVFAYPVLMAADILMYDADLVPVGKDQKQHVEMARDMAGSFNAIYGEGVIKAPEPYIEERVMVIPGLDGRKMSKSYDNVIPLFGEPKALRKRVLSIVTDSTPLEEPKSMRGTLLGDLFTLFGTKSEFEDLESRLQRGGLGWGHAKDELFQVIDREISGPRERYTQIRGDERGVEAVLKDGAERARQIAGPVIDRVRRAVGVG